MARTAKSLSCSETEWRELEKLTQDEIEPARLLLRAKIVLACLAGKRNDEVAAELGLSTTTVALWRRRFAAQGIDGLLDRPRPGKPRKFPMADFRQRLLAQIAKPPPPGKTNWDGYSLADVLGVSADAIYRMLREEHITLRRQRTWNVKTDSHFVAKSTDIVGLFLSPPENALVISIDDKPHQRTAVTTGGRVVTWCGNWFQDLTRQMESDGTIPLIAALNAASDVSHLKATTKGKWPDVRQFLGCVVEEGPADREVHVILDNGREHLNSDDWLAAYPNVLIHRALGTASWLNQVESWFKILKVGALHERSSPSSEEFASAIGSFIRAFNERSIPFVWRKDEETNIPQQNSDVDLRDF
jgi:transposase